MSSSRDKTPKFEDALKRLEEIVALMEDEKITLEAALKYYEEGVSLVKSCSRILDAAEKKIEILSAGAGESARAVPFAPEEPQEERKRGTRRSTVPGVEEDTPPENGEQFLL